MKILDTCTEVMDKGVTSKAIYGGVTSYCGGNDLAAGEFFLNGGFPNSSGGNKK
jgi:hypothetical protein